MVKKAWKWAVDKSGLSGLQLKDLRHTSKTNAHRSKMVLTTRNAICGHSSRLVAEDLYINVSDREVVGAVGDMTLDHGCTQLDVLEEMSIEPVGKKTRPK